MNQKFTFTTTLIVDDNEVDLLVNRRLMELTYFSKNIVAVKTAEEALEFLNTECTSAKYVPDLILLDIHLPGMSGYEFIEEFKKLPDHIRYKTKIVVLTVFEKQQQLEKVLKNDFVITNAEKPLTQETLRQLAIYKNESEKVSM